jgi:hypothetical protein
MIRYAGDVRRGQDRGRHRRDLDQLGHVSCSTATMLPRTPATPGTAAVPSLHVHSSSPLGGMRSSSLELGLLQDGVTPPAIDLNRTPVHVDSAQMTRKQPRDTPPAVTLHVRVLFDEMPTRPRPSRYDPIRLHIHSFEIYNVP